MYFDPARIESTSTSTGANYLVRLEEKAWYLEFLVFELFVDPFSTFSKSTVANPFFVFTFGIFLHWHRCSLLPGGKGFGVLSLSPSQLSARRGAVKTL